MCNSKNVNGNIMDMAITTQIKMLAEDQDTFISQLEQSRKFYTGNRANYEKQLVSMRQKKADLEKKMDGLADSLVDLGDSVARNYVVKRMEQLGLECAGIDARIQELECLTSQHALSELEFDVMRQLLSVFKSGIDEMTIEQKRAAIRTIVRKVVWDGVNAHVILYGVQEDDREDDLKSLPGEASADTLPDPDTACSCS